MPGYNIKGYHRLVKSGNSSTGGRMSDFLPGDLVRIFPLTNKPKYHPMSDQLGVVIEHQIATGLYRVMLMGDENLRIFRYASTLLRKV